MLHSTSWLLFLQDLAGITFIYYFAVITVFFWKEAKALFIRLKRRLLLVVAGTILIASANAQDGNSGITQANTMIRGYFDSGSQLMYAIGAVFALVGAIRTYKEWNSGHQQEAYRAATGWFGSCIFLVVVTTVIRSFFGL